MKKTSYQQYLQSPKWKELRAAARARAGNKCELCGGAPDHVHHVRYPKRYQDDHIDNLLVACASCHSKMHGVRDNRLITAWFASVVGVGITDGELSLRISLESPSVGQFTPIVWASWVTEYGDTGLDAQFGGQVFILGQNYTVDVPFSDAFFKDMRDLTPKDILMLGIESSRHEWTVPNDMGQAMVQAMIDPLPSVVCVPPEGVHVPARHAGQSLPWETQS